MIYQPSLLPLAFLMILLMKVGKLWILPNLYVTHRSAKQLKVSFPGKQDLRKNNMQELSVEYLTSFKRAKIKHTRKRRCLIFSIKQRNIQIYKSLYICVSLSVLSWPGGWASYSFPLSWNSSCHWEREITWSLQMLPEWGNTQNELSFVGP